MCNSSLSNSVGISFIIAMARVLRRIFSVTSLFIRIGVRDFFLSPCREYAVKSVGVDSVSSRHAVIKALFLRIPILGLADFSRCRNLSYFGLGLQVYPLSNDLV